MGSALYHVIKFLLNLPLSALFSAPNPQAHNDNCQKPGEESRKYCNRGHLVPSGAFNTKNERDLTFIMTNIAPQWLPFNDGNWRSVEDAVKAYANKAGHGVYVFTGTGRYHILSEPVHHVKTSLYILPDFSQEKNTR